MTKVITLAGLSQAKKLSNGRDKCTPVRTTDEIEGRPLIVCKEDLGNALPIYESTEQCAKRSKSGRCIGRPRGSSPKNSQYQTRKGSRAKAPSVKWCSPEDRQWVDSRVGPNKKKVKRCKCMAPGNKRYLKDSECK